MTDHTNTSPATDQGAVAGAEGYWLDLPFDRPPLNHNQRLDPRAKAKVVAQIRGDVGWLAKSRAIPHAERITVQLHYAPGRRGRRDPMNLTATTKPAIDGLVDAGVVADDDSEHVIEIPPAIHFPPEPGPRCWLIVTVHQDSPVDGAGVLPSTGDTTSDGGAA